MEIKRRNFTFYFNNFSHSIDSLERDATKKLICVCQSHVLMVFVLIVCLTMNVSVILGGLAETVTQISMIVMKIHA